MDGWNAMNEVEAPGDAATRAYEIKHTPIEIMQDDG